MLKQGNLLTPVRRCFSIFLIVNHRALFNRGIALHVPEGSKIDPNTGKLVVPDLPPQPKKKKEKPREKEPIEGTDWVRIIVGRYISCKRLSYETADVISRPPRTTSFI